MRPLREYASLAYNVSRPRFWFYVAGPFTVGCIWGAQRATALLTPEFFAYLFYFLLPANVFLYGVNDYWDHDTDRLNPKKGGKEHLLDPSERSTLKVFLIAMTVTSLALMVFQSWSQRLVFGMFLFLSYFYSAKPLRFKATPFFDSSSNFFYALPGVFGYLLFTGELPPTIIMLAALLHSTAMHLFSAIPDIEWDKSVNLITTAVKIGERGSTLICLSLWTVFSVTVIMVGGFSPLSFLPIIYPSLVALVIIRGLEVSDVYWFYPYINTGLGGLLFLVGFFRIPF